MLSCIPFHTIGNPKRPPITPAPQNSAHILNHFRIFKPDIPISACYTKNRSTHTPKTSSIAPLISIAQRGLPFTAADGQAFVRLTAAASGGFYILPIRSSAYRDWFFRQFFAEYDTIPTPNAFHAILHHLEAQATTNERVAVFRRVGSRGPSLSPHQILLDLANPECQFVEISSTGWRTTAGANALLETSRSTVSLPAPLTFPTDAPAAPLEILRSCLNVSTRAGWLRCLAWLMAALRPYGPFPVLILNGPPGSGKTFAARVLRSLIDPSTAPLAPIPSSVRELLSLARHNWILAFDHISVLSPKLTDALCRLASGLGAAVRETGTSTGEPLMQYYKRPALLTATHTFICPADLAERALTVTFAPLSPDRRRTEANLLTVFDDAWPGILAALCSAVSTALNRLPLVLASGRCADTLAWAMAASPALGCTETEMLQAFNSAPPHPIVEAVHTFLEQRRHWTGSATQLLKLLHPAPTCRTAKGLSQQLRSRTLILAGRGIDVKFRRLPNGHRIIDLRVG